jgi:predicted GNAT family acetyltransferase
MCGGLPESAIGSVIDEIAPLRPDLNGVSGPRDIATNFAATWRAATGTVGAVRMRQRLHRLNELRPPAEVTGEARPAEKADDGLINHWLNGFRADALGKPTDSAVDPRHVRRAKESPDAFLLWTVDDEPVGLAGVRLPIVGVSRIGPVYIPPETRGHGYGSAVTAAAAAWALRAAATEVVLFTDPDNPASNAAYRRVGFQPVSDYVRIDFSPGS